MSLFLLVGHFLLRLLLTWTFNQSGILAHTQFKAFATKKYSNYFIQWDFF